MLDIWAGEQFNFQKQLSISLSSSLGCNETWNLIESNDHHRGGEEKTQRIPKINFLGCDSLKYSTLVEHSTVEAHIEPFVMWKRKPSACVGE